MTIKITPGTTSRTVKGVKMTEQPRSIMDRVMGRVTTNFSRPVPTIKLTKQKNNTFKPTGPTSNGIGVGP